MHAANTLQLLLLFAEQ